MDDLQSLKRQLEEARDDAELNLLQLQQVQEELEFYFLRCQQLERDLAKPSAAPKPSTAASEEFMILQDALKGTQAQLSDLEQQRSEEQRLLRSAQTMLEGQASYLADVSYREEQAAQALDRLRNLEAEIRYYLSHSRPQSSLDPQRINRLIQLAKQPASSREVEA